MAAMECSMLLKFAGLCLVLVVRLRSSEAAALECYETNCDKNKPPCTEAVVSCSSGECMTKTVYVGGVLTSVERGCNDYYLSHIKECKITVNTTTATTTETCVCDTPHCNFQEDVVNQTNYRPLQCLQCDYLDDPACIYLPEDKSFVVDCPLWANYCVLETETLIGKYKKATRYCARWDGVGNNCTSTRKPSDVCFCTGNECNNLAYESSLSATTTQKAAASATIQTSTLSGGSQSSTPNAAERHAIYGSKATSLGMLITLFVFAYFIPQ